MRISHVSLKSLFILLVSWTFIILLLITRFTVVKYREIEWYFSDGIEYPIANEKSLKLFYDQDQGDRIIEQLMYVPPNYNKSSAKTKKILMYFGLTEPDPENLFNICPVSSCTVTASKSEASTSDAIIFAGRFRPPLHYRSPEQIWIMYWLECPFHTWELKNIPNLINWTATYRRDSDIVTPYEKWVYYDKRIKQKPQTRNYALNKTRKVAWFVSNCWDTNNRLKYAKKLATYIPVDIYGSCGTLNCPRTDPNCFKLLEQYKFYLSFENSNCHDYITEKFFANALGNNVLPIVMGPSKEDYIKVAPKNSFIHVNDFKDPKELASYLNFLDINDKAYNLYFNWKGTGEFINTYFWCRVCAMLHSPHKRKSYEDINTWWKGPGICST